MNTLMPVPIAGVIEATSSAAQIRIWLRERGLPPSSTKTAMVARLLEMDPNFAPPGAKERHYVCAGHLVGSCPQSELATHLQPVAPTKTALQHLEERDIRGAVRSVMAYQAAGIFPPGRATEWLDPRHRREMRNLLIRIFTTWPTAIDDIPARARGAYRVAAGMMALLDARNASEWIASATCEHPRLSREDVVRWVLWSSSSQTCTRRWRRPGDPHV